ncbi:MAG: hypothetical protein HY674_09735 [Chloroflexi bacterium]|nr:hypothetical protein [Chloroflexota bacterium]
MPLPLDEVFRRMAVAKGNLSASLREREEAQAWQRWFIDQLTRQQQQESPGDLSITHESIRAALETAYRDYRRQQERATRRRLLQDRD